MSKRRVLVYGAGGRTGQAIARHAKSRGIDVIIAGRSASSIAGIAQMLGCETRVAVAGDKVAWAAMLLDVGLVVNAAGPFSDTASAVVEACVAAHCHYLDVNGEFEAYRDVAEWGPEAVKAGVLLMPGAGYCAIASTFLLADLLVDPRSKPSMLQPTQVRIAFSGGPASSVGSIKSLFASLQPSIDIVQDHAFTAVPIGSLERAFDFTGCGGRLACTAMSVADILAIHYDSPPSLRQIEAYVEGNLATRTFFEASGRFTRFSKVQPLKALVDRSMSWWPATPDSGVDTQCALYVEVVNPWLEKRQIVHLTPSTYEFTAIAASALAELIVAGVGVKTGFHTPASLYLTHPTVKAAFTFKSPPVPAAAPRRRRRTTA